MYGGKVFYMSEMCCITLWKSEVWRCMGVRIAWCMVHGAWCMVHGAWCMVHSHLAPGPAATTVASSCDFCAFSGIRSPPRVRVSATARCDLFHYWFQDLLKDLLKGVKYLYEHPVEEGHQLLGDGGGGGHGGVGGSAISQPQVRHTSWEGRLATGRRSGHD